MRWPWKRRAAETPEPLLVVVDHDGNVALVIDGVEPRPFEVTKEAA